MNQPADWRHSRYASEFLPQEIQLLDEAAMELCTECQWPRLKNGGCDNCKTLPSDHGELTGLPNAP